ncbi:MAG: GNAT family N-acetyltransferase [Candidatus Cyclobacteriaceae bacterium M3_2C_046]
MITEFSISTDQARLDINLIHTFLSQEAYWALGRSRETVEKSVQNSLCFGVYQQEQQVGFARVVTDYAVFAWILDVFILKDFRGQGLGNFLIEAITSHHELKHLQRWGLATNDAHGLYRNFGFNLIANPENFMEKVFPPS